MDIKKKDTGKVKTNPRYRCLDEDSDDGEGGHQKNEDLQALSSKEADFRDTIMKYESKCLIS